MTKKNGVNHSMLMKVKSRRKAVIERLEAQLKSGLKSKHPWGEAMPLSDNDRSRIKKEIETLNKRIV
jgi:hypothetical protein